MMKYLLWSVVLTFGFNLCFAQNNNAIVLDSSGTYDRTYFINPVGHKIALSGSFCELRSNHFHSGIDIKPKKYNTSEPIKVAASGYVSRIKIKRGGYGRALYVDHPNGYTSVYAHLLTFSDSLEQYIEKIQYELESFEVDIFLDRDEIVVQQGEIIGMMGSTGRSFGTHLHFEIRETKTETPVNPMLFGIGPDDHKNPLIYNIMVHALDPDMVVLKKYKFPSKRKSAGIYVLDKKDISIPAWNVGIAIHSFDKMDGSNNTNGIYSLEMFVDDSLHYGFTFDKISFDETYFINGHIDYDTKMKVESTFQLCYQTPGNTLDIFHHKGNGKIKLFKNKKRHIKIIVKDIMGNESNISFTVKRDVNIKEIERPDYNFIINYNDADTLKFGHINAFIPAQSVYRKSYISCKESEGYSFKIGDKFIPLRKSFRIHVDGLPNDSLAQKRCVVWKKDKSWVSYGGHWDGHQLTTNLRKFGTYKVMLDITKPTVKIIKFPKKINKKTRIQLKVLDNIGTNGDAKSIAINVYIDGKWQIYGYKSMTNIVSLKVPKYLQKGKHNFLLIAKDDRGNVNEFKRNFELL